jgi:hypothetical protein
MRDLWNILIWALGIPFHLSPLRKREWNARLLRKVYES